MIRLGGSEWGRRRTAVPLPWGGGVTGALEVGVLGPQIIRVSGTEIDAPAPQQRRVLSLLASRPGEVVAREWLTEGLWGSATATQMRSLQVYVSNLRSILGKSAIDLVGNGYRLNVDPSAVDEVRFRDLVARGTAALSRGHFDEAVEALQEALAEWRGDPYDDLNGPDFSARRSGLWEMLHGAEDALLRARLEMVRSPLDAESLVALTAQGVAEQPRREGRIITHARALMAAGRPADASAALNDFRLRLRADAGIDPGKEFAETSNRILRREPSGMPAAWGSAIEVPDFSTPLLLRDLELDLTLGLLREDARRLVTLAGPDGVGKTRLAGEVARAMAPGAPGGVLWMEFDQERGANGLLADIAARLRLEAKGADLRKHLPKALNHRRTLIVIDAAEPGILPAVAVLLTGGPSTCILVTAPQALGLASEHIVELHPFATHNSDMGSPAARFVAALAEHFLGAQIDISKQVEAAVSATDGTPRALEQLTLDLLTTLAAS